MVHSFSMTSRTTCALNSSEYLAADMVSILSTQGKKNSPSPRNITHPRFRPPGRIHARHPGPAPLRPARRTGHRPTRRDTTTTPYRRQGVHRTGHDHPEKKTRKNSPPPTRQGLHHAPHYMDGQGVPVVLCHRFGHAGPRSPPMRCQCGLPSSTRSTPAMMSTIPATMVRVSGSPKRNREAIAVTATPPADQIP